MKIISAILAVLILFLTAQPLLAVSVYAHEKQIAVTDKCCAHKHSNPSSKDKDGNCCNEGHCDNPFLSCSNCIFTSFDKSTFSFAPFFTKNKKINPVNDNVLSSYIQDFWHPPEAV